MLVALYARISEDPNDTRLGVQRQVDDCEALARIRGWDTEHYIDNDRSAYKRKVVRPRFEDMLTDLTGGKVQGVVVYDLDRFARQPRDLERAIDIFDERPGLAFATVQGDINLATADGRTMARVMVAFANKSSADTGRRVARKHLENARSGKPVGGWRPFGWREDKTTLDPEEAAAMRRVIDYLLSGGSFRTAAQTLTDMGYTTTAGGEWTHHTLRQYLRNPRLVGVRTHQRKVLLDDEGEPVRGLWTPLVDGDTWTELHELLSGAERRSRVPRKGARHYLLTGILFCGACSAPMYGNKVGNTHYYACKGNGHTVTASGGACDDLVASLTLARLASEELTATTQGDWPGEEGLARRQAQIDSLMAAFMDQELSGDVVFPRVRALEQEVAELREGRAQWLLETTGPAMSRITHEEWEEMDTDVRRAIIEKVLEAVLVRPATRRGNRFDPERLVPVFRGGRTGLRAVPS